MMSSVGVIAAVWADRLAELFVWVDLAQRCSQLGRSPAVQ